jgi:hypothetical protein
MQVVCRPRSAGEATAARMLRARHPLLNVGTDATRGAAEVEKTRSSWGAPEARPGQKAARRASATPAPAGTVFIAVVWEGCPRVARGL